MDLRQALEQAGSLGAFASVEARSPRGAITLQELFGDPALVRERIEATRTALAGADRLETVDGLRVAASVWQLGMAARITSPALATAVLGGWVPDLGLTRVWCQPRRPSPIPLALPNPSGRRADGPEAVSAAFGDLVLDQAATSLVDVVAASVSISESVLWGNVWSGLAGNLAAIGATRSDLLSAAREVIGAIFERARSGPPTPAMVVGGFDRAGRYRRSTCCLIYRIPSAGLCGDCVLRRTDPA
jgi:hypothetical protein